MIDKHVDGISKKRRIDVDQAIAIEEGVLNTLDGIDHACSRTWAFGKKHKRFLKGFIGLVLVLHGGEFTNTVLLVEAFHLSGGHKIIDGFQHLGRTYRKVRAAMDEVIPVIKKSQAELDDLVSKFDALKEDIKSTKEKIRSEDAADLEHLAPKLYDLGNSYADFTASKNHARRLSHAMLAVQNAVDPKHLKEIVHQIYATTLSSLGAVKYQTGATVTMGASIARVIYTMERKLFFGMIKKNAFPHVRKVKVHPVKMLKSLFGFNNSTHTTGANETVTINVHPETKRVTKRAASMHSKHRAIQRGRHESRGANAAAAAEGVSHHLTKAEHARVERLIEHNLQWLNTASHAVAHVVGMCLAFKFRKVAMIMTTASLGSHMLVDVLEDVLDPVLHTMGLPPLDHSPETWATLQSAVLILGIYLQLHPGTGKLPKITQMTLAPFAYCEKIIKSALKIEHSTHAMTKALKLG